LLLLSLCMYDLYFFGGGGWEMFGGGEGFFAIRGGK